MLADVGTGLSRRASNMDTVLARNVEMEAA